MSFSRIMGIVNLTPDSFSDGGTLTSPQHVWEKVAPWVARGIAWIDLGAESTRPGSTPLSWQEEWARLAPTLTFLAQQDLAHTSLSIDSYHPETWKRACDITPHVGMINCVAPLSEARKACFLQLHHTHPPLLFLLTHRHGESFRTMQTRPLSSTHVAQNVEAYFDQVIRTLCLEGGIPRHQLWLDPGVGFGKDLSANQTLLAHARPWSQKYTLCYGISRKSFLGELSREPNPQKRDVLSNTYERSLLQSGVRLIRTHTPLALCET